MKQQINQEDIHEMKQDSICEMNQGELENQVQIMENKCENAEIQDVLEFAVEAGRTLLRNGAEIFRVEETITHICNHYQVKDLNLFVLSNGIFVTAEKEGREIYAKVKHVPLSGTHFGIVDGVNDLSRRICAGEVSLENARKQLEEIAALPPKRPYFRVIAAGIGCGCFCYLMDATILDSLRTVIVTILVNTFVVYGAKAKLSKMVINTVGGMLVSIFAILICRENGMVIMESVDKVSIGAIFSLIPGVAFVNSLRDLANSDFISGIVKMMDAILGFIYIAIGSGVVLATATNLIGGIMI